MTKLGFIAWLALGTLAGLLFLIHGVIWCVSPQTYVRVHRALFPKHPITNAARWESSICCIEGRISGAVLACFGVILLYLVWFEIAWKQWTP